jgi:hypothetical protein
MSDYTTIADDYISIWNEADPGSRAERIAKAFAPDATYVDPLAAVGGAEAINETITAVRGQFPGWSFRLLGPVDGHHDQARFRWEFGPEGAEAPVVGFDVVVLGHDGRLRSVYGFLDKVPPAA